MNIRTMISLRKQLTASLYHSIGGTLTHQVNYPLHVYGGNKGGFSMMSADSVPLPQSLNPTRGLAQTRAELIDRIVAAEGSAAYDKALESQFTYTYSVPDNTALINALKGCVRPLKGLSREKKAEHYYWDQKSNRVIFYSKASLSTCARISHEAAENALAGNQVRMLTIFQLGKALDGAEYSTQKWIEIGLAPLFEADRKKQRQQRQLAELDAVDSQERRDIIAWFMSLSTEMMQILYNTWKAFNHKA